MLVFLNQQLTTGLAAVLAGYYEVLKLDLDILHWHNVTYLAWLSSTIHLVSLSPIRDHLNDNHTLRNIRLAGMSTLLVLTAVALVPTITTEFAHARDAGSSDDSQ